MRHEFKAFPPMEAKLVSELPDGADWQYEPKWDGFRAIAHRAGKAAEIFSKSEKPLGRYFPEIIALLLAIEEDHFVLDGELILPLNGVLAFDALQARLHPAASRIARLSKETPAQFMLFDALRIGTDDLAGRRLSERRRALETFHRQHGGPDLLLSPCSTDRDQALAWLADSGGALDGVMAKRRDEPYRPGDRAMLKVKQRRTADCVIGGFRRSEDGLIASLLLGLYDAAGKLDHVGFVSSFEADQRAALAKKLEALEGGPGFTGKAPGGPSRWSAGRDTAYVPLKPELVAEILYDQVTAQRFRHAVKFLRWRPDKAPRQCDFAQLEPSLSPAQLGID